MLSRKKFRNSKDHFYYSRVKLNSLRSSVFHARCWVEVELPKGHVVAIVVPGPCRFLGMFGRRDDFVIPWSCIRKIGPDIILVDIKPDDCLFPRPGLGWGI